MNLPFYRICSHPVLLYINVSTAKWWIFSILYTLQILNQFEDGSWPKFCCYFCLKYVLTIPLYVCDLSFLKIILKKYFLWAFTAQGIPVFFL